PRSAYPGRVEAESRIPEETLAELRRRGHEVRLIEGWSNGKPLAIHCHVDRGLILGAATARNNIAYAMGW
ncbi:MAG: gamma-glutamyltransferase, partial [Spirochaetaceae bacterium]|nr:gamma-glutamyltransferase [Spirochaetaceae bacterium]